MLGRHHLHLYPLVGLYDVQVYFLQLIFHPEWGVNLAPAGLERDFGGEQANTYPKV